jgi:hypothetical protein
VSVAGGVVGSGGVVGCGGGAGGEVGCGGDVGCGGSVGRSVGAGGFGVRVGTVWLACICSGVAQTCGLADGKPNKMTAASRYPARR